MKSKALSLLAFAGTLLLTAACTGDDVADKQPETPNTEPGALTTFAVEPDAPKTRTTGDYDGTGIGFYWTEGDRLWVHNSAAAPALQQSARSNIADLLTLSTTPGGIDRTAIAKFYFSGTYTEDSYPVRYTGKNSTQGDKVTFKTVQSQPVPNDASHIGESGDCGIAIAHRAGGSYHFTLDHKAAYLTFVPYSTQAEVSEAVITQIRVFAYSQAIAGEFSLDDNGIVPASGPAPSAGAVDIYGGNNNKTIVLTVNALPIPSAPDPAANAAIMVLPPGTYPMLDVEYTVRSTVTGQTGIIYKTYNNVTLAAGKNKKVSADLQVTVYNPQYVTGGVYDKTNRNATIHYILKGGCGAASSLSDKHLWDDMAWVAEGHLYSGGIWLGKVKTSTNYHYLVEQQDLYYSPKPIYKHKRDSGPIRRKLIPQRAFFVPAIYGPGNFGESGRYWYGGEGKLLFSFDRNGAIGIGSGPITDKRPYFHRHY